MRLPVEDAVIDEAFMACAAGGFALPILALVFWFVTRGPAVPLTDREVSQTLDQTSFRLTGRARRKLAQYCLENPGREPRLVVERGGYRLELAPTGTDFSAHSRIDGVWASPDVMATVHGLRCDWIGGDPGGFKFDPSGPVRDSLALIEEPGRGRVPKFSRAGGPYVEIEEVAGLKDAAVPRMGGDDGAVRA